MTGRTYQLKSINWEWTAQNDEDSLHEGFSPDSTPDNELSTEEALRVIDQLAALKCETVCVQGGTIFYRHDWETLAQSIIQKGINLTLIAGGEGIRQQAGKLKKYFKGIAITLEGPAYIHDMVKQLFR